VRQARARLMDRLQVNRLPELLLAQLSMLIAKTMGGAKNVRVDDFMLKEPEVLPDNVTHIDIARKAFGFNPRRKKA